MSVQNSPGRFERIVGRAGLVMGLALFTLLVLLVCVALALSLDEGSWWRAGLGAWIIGLAAIGLIGGAAYVVRRNW